MSDPDAALDALIDTVRKDERDAIAKWLIEGSADIARMAEWPVWRGVLWEILHPVRFGVATALAKAGIAIHYGEHAAQWDRSGEADETRSGSAVGESPVLPQAGCAQTRGDS